jgi:uncharacterized protein with PQ loop repeat
MQQGHHFLMRKKSGIPRFPARWKPTVDKFLYIIAIVAPFSYLPQTYKLYATHDSAGLAIETFATLFFINLAWLIYGWAHRSSPLVITSVLFCAFHVAIVGGIMLL